MIRLNRSTRAIHKETPMFHIVEFVSGHFTGKKVKMGKTSVKGSNPKRIVRQALNRLRA